MQQTENKLVDYPKFNDLVLLQIYVTGDEGLVINNIERIVKAQTPFARRLLDDQNAPTMMLSEEFITKIAHPGVTSNLTVNQENGTFDLKYRNFFPVLKGIKNQVEVYQIRDYPNDMCISVGGMIPYVNQTIDFFDPFGLVDKEGLKLGSKDEYFYLSGLALVFGKASDYEGRIAKFRSYDEDEQKYLTENEGKTSEDFLQEVIKEHCHDPILGVEQSNSYQIRGIIEQIEECDYADNKMLCITVSLIQYGTFKLRINIYASVKILGDYVPQCGDEIYSVSMITGTRQDLFNISLF